MENRKFWTEFIEMYRDLPCLWKVKSSEYSNRILKIHAYEQLIKKLKEIYPNANRNLAVKKINNIRTNYRRDRRKIEESKQAGDEEIYVSPLWYYDLMRFVEDQNVDDNGTERKPIKEYRFKSENMHPHPATASATASASAHAPSPKKKVVYDEDKLIKLAMEKLTNNDNGECINISKGWAAQYDEMEAKQKIFARKLISDVLFLGNMGDLDMSHVIQIQDILVQRTTSVEVKIERDIELYDSEEELLVP